MFSSRKFNNQIKYLIHSKEYDDEGAIVGMKPFNIGNWMILRDINKTCDNADISLVVELEEPESSGDESNDQVIFNLVMGLSK